MGIWFELAAEFGKWPAVFAQHLEQDQHRQNAGVSAIVVAEVIVTGMLSTKDRPRLFHDLLDVRVSDPGPYRHTTGGPYCLRHCLGADEVVDDALARMLRQKPSSDDGSHRAPREGLELVVDEESPVSVTIKRHA